MPPAARVTDMHTCPMFTGPVPHVGGPILPPGAPTVLIGMLPAARVTDMLVCVGPPDMIAKGSAGVFINFLPAARMGDITAHGGVIILGLPTVMIGEIGSPSPGAGGLGGVTAGLALAGVSTPINPNASVLGMPGTRSDNPPYEPDKWNKQPVKGTTNCYSYAANDPSGHTGDHTTQPGVRCGHPYTGTTCAEVAKAATCDGMTPAPDPPPPKPGYYVVALVCDPGVDYHWYRQDDNGRWSHKPGSTDATNVDASGKPITDPKTANRDYSAQGGPNYKWCDKNSYFYVPAGGIKTGPP